jgi:hypothetical protein
VLGGNVGLELGSYEQNWQPDECPVFCKLVRGASDIVTFRRADPHRRSRGMAHTRRPAAGHSVRRSVSILVRALCR